MSLLRSRRHFFFVVAMAGAAVALATGCGTSPATTTIVCTDFRAGADLSGSTFGVTGDLQRSYGAFAQAAGDLSAVANEMLRDVGAACQALAVELGADRQDPRTLGKLEPDAVRAWCTIAAERFERVRPELARAHFAVQVVTPKCTVDTGFQVECERDCVADRMCKEVTLEERCPVDAREGICAGTCIGRCTGSETAAAACAGTCDGTCFGSCGEAKESADCELGCACPKVCTGSCTASCNSEKGARCDAVCSGHCSEPMIAPSCTKPLAPPMCAGDADCQKSCGASSAARAVCPAGPWPS